MRRWLPPHRVVIKQPRHVGDFLDGVFSFVVSERFKVLYEESKMTGIREFYALEVVRMGTSKAEKSYPKPILYGVEVVHSLARIDYDLSVTKWWKPPQPSYCRRCGPGLGGKAGTPERFEGLHFEEGTWQGEDFFYTINLAGTVLVSEIGAAFLEKHCFTNMSLRSGEGYCHDMFEGDFLPRLA